MNKQRKTRKRGAGAGFRYSDFTLYRRLLRQARPYWAHIAAIFVLGLLSTPLALLTPLPLKIAVDSVVGAHPVPDFLYGLLPAAIAPTPVPIPISVPASVPLVASPPADVSELVAASDALPPLDWELPGGRFFTQANGLPLGASTNGFAITDSEGIAFWSAYERFGGPDTLGYPISHRFEWRGRVVQLTQRGLLQSWPETNEVRLGNLLDDLHDAGFDERLSRERLIPKQKANDAEAGLTFPEVAARRVALLDRDPAIRKRYFDSPDPFHEFGLPTSDIVDLGPVVAVRTQRGALQRWKTPMPWADAGDVTVVQAGDLAREFGLFGAPAALFPPADAAQSGIAVLVLAAGLVVGIALLGQLLDLASALLRTYTGEQLVLRFRTQLFRHVQRLSLSYHDAKGTADSVYRIQYDATATQYFVVDGVLPLITAGCTLVGMIYVTARIDWQLALVALAVTPVLILTSRAYRRRLRSQSGEVKHLESSALSVVQEVLAAARVVKAFGQEDREQERFVRRFSEGVRARIRLAFIEGGFGLLVGVTIAMGTATVLLVGMDHVRAGVLTLGEFLVVMAYLSQLYEPLRTIGRKAARLQSHLASAERAFALLDEAPDVPERPNARTLSRASGSVAFRSVSFAYGQDRPVLHEISFEIAPGTRLGIVGTTGAGKTTLISLLTRFYDPTGGQILLDGADLREYRLEDLRRQFAIVLQEPVLFSASIAENIAYAYPGASEQEIVTAAQAANAHEFIARLPHGYDTQVGERGIQLSGGQRQRITLARAFLKDAPILILDEPTSSVDVQTEAAIMEAIERLMRGRTTIMIAHRPSTLAHCHARLHIERGYLVEPTPSLALVPGGATP